MAAAIWSSKPNDILDFPAATFLRFCQNHGLLQINNRPQWKTVAGGGREYVRKMLAALPDVRVGSPVTGVTRHEGGATVHTDRGSETFDAVVMACHAPDTLRLLTDADDAESPLLRAFSYQDNLAILHTDPALLPRRQKVWSAWNYLAQGNARGGDPVCVSYLINQLQPLPFKTPVVVTLNPIAMPAPEHELARFHYAHPVFDAAAIAAQSRLPDQQGRRATWFAGAWTGYGFHEDGLKSALRVAASFGCLPAWAKV
jgi:predicted NAD/FAD-binding protein